ncbi:MAG: hypothetical protein KAQ87_03825 [Candidatus Pacebacteria bacterium]|nr:hypothetical protein [Candidatus Paceibacterota bacterium]
MNKAIKIGGTLAVVMATAFTISSAFAYQGDYSKQGPAQSAERHTAMTEAMENNDYEAWSELMADRGRVAKIINAENFAQFAEAHELAHNGDLKRADEIRKELGLKTRDGEKIGAKFGGGQGYGKMNSGNYKHNDL